MAKFTMDIKTELFYLLYFNRLDNDLSRVFVTLLFFLLWINEVKLYKVSHSDK